MRRRVPERHATRRRTGATRSRGHRPLRSKEAMAVSTGGSGGGEEKPARRRRRRVPAMGPAEQAVDKPAERKEKGKPRSRQNKGKKRTQQKARLLGFGRGRILCDRGKFRSIVFGRIPSIPKWRTVYLQTWATSCTEEMCENPYERKKLGCSASTARAGAAHGDTRCGASLIRDFSVLTTCSSIDILFIHSSVPSPSVHALHSADGSAAGPTSTIPPRLSLVSASALV